MKISNKLYDILKWIALIMLPASAVLYGVLAKTWGLPYGDEIVGTINAVATFIGVLIGVSTLSYNKDQFIEDRLPTASEEEMKEEIPSE